jgi:hypothetical protein
VSGLLQSESIIARSRLMESSQQSPRMIQVGVNYFIEESWAVFTLQITNVVQGLGVEDCRASQK